MGDAVTNRNWAWILVTSTLATASLRAAGAEAQETPATDVSRAESYAAEAFEAYRSKDYDQAVALYRKALEATPSPDILYNLARIYDTKLKDRASAIEFYSRYADDPGADPARLRMVTERLTRLRELERIASQSTDGSPTAPVPGSIRGEASATPAKLSASTRSRSGGISTARVVGILVGAAGVAGVGVGVGFGLAARSDTQVAHDQCDGNACFTQRGVDAAKDAKRAATVSTIAFISGGALLVGGLALIVFGPDATERDVASVHVVPYAGHDRFGTQIAGRF
jgi:hypothetical protein